MKYFYRLFLMSFFLTLPFYGHCQVNYYGGAVDAVYSSTASQLIIMSKKTDSKKNTYITGYYNTNGTTFSIGGSTYTCSGAQDAFFIKIDVSGIIKWHCVFTASSTERLDDIAFDNNENPIVLGFIGSQDAVIKTGTTILKTLYTNGGIRPFVMAFDKVSGIPSDPIYLIDKGGASVIQARVSNLNISNNEIVITGLVKGANFTVGGGATLYSSSSSSYYDLYILKGTLSPFSVSLIKLYPTTSTGTGTFFNSISKITNGYYLTGLVFGTTLANAKVTFPTLTGNRDLSNSNFKYDFFTFFTDLSLNGQWALQSTGNATNNDKQIQGASLDNLGNLYITGYNKSSSFNVESIYSGTTVSNKSIVNADATGVTSDVFLLKYNNLGKLMSYKALGDNSNQASYEIQSFGNKIAQVGSFNGSLILGKDTLKSSATTDQDGYLALFDTTNLTPIGAVQIKGTGTENAEKFYYNGSDFNPIIGTLASTPASSVTLKTVGGDVVLTNTAGKSIYVANACPIIGLFEDPTTNYYIDPSNPNSGSLAITVKGDVPGGYSYSWSDGANTSSSRSGLVEGNYTLTTKYLNNKCSKQRVFSFKNSIKEGAVTATNPTSCTPANGSIYAEATDMTGTYGVIQFSVDSITWVDGTLMAANKYNYTFSGLSDGVYQLYYRFKNLSIHDRLKGSIKTINYASNPIKTVTTTVTPVTCKGELNGEITINTTYTGSPNLNYSISGDATYLTYNTFDKLPAGQQCDIWVKDLNTSCKYHGATVNLSNPVEMIATATSCYSAESSSGGILVSVTGGIAPFRYQLYASDATLLVASQLSNQFSITGSLPASYFVEVTDANGCIKPTNVVTISNTSPSLIDFTALTIGSLCGVIPGRIIVSATGGTGLYTYQLNSGTAQSDNRFENLAIDINPYSVTLIDAAGCSLTKGGNTVSSISPMPMSYFRANR